MTSDTKVLVTHESLERAVSLMAQVMEMDVPGRELRLYHPEDLSDSLTKDAKCFVHLDEGYICLPQEVEENSMFHEAAHWVLLNNGHNYSSQGELIYGRMIDEMLAILAQMTLTGSTYEPLLTKAHTIKKKDSQICVREAFETDHTSFLSLVQEKKRMGSDKEVLLRIKNCESQMKLCDMRVSVSDYLYWHFTLEDGWADTSDGKRTWQDFMLELKFFHDALQDDDPLVTRVLTEGLAHRAAVAHYMYQHKPQDLVNGLLKFGEEHDYPLTFSYFIFTAEMARNLFEKKEVEKWMHQPKYLMP